MASLILFLPCGYLLIYSGFLLLLLLLLVFCFNKISRFDQWLV